MAAKKTLLNKQVTTRIKRKAKPSSPKKERVTLQKQNTQARLRIRKTMPKGLQEVRHMDFSISEPLQYKQQLINIKPKRMPQKAPSNVSFQLEPLENGVLVYHTMPGFTNKEKAMAQLSVRATIFNTGTENIDLDKVVMQYKKGSQTVTKNVYLSSDKLIIEPGFGRVWQNNREYHENGDIVFLQAPFPTKVVLKFYFKNYTSPITITENLKPYNKGLAFPFDTSEFAKNEFVTGYSMHGGGSQVFAYDLGANIYQDSYWTALKKDKDGSKNDHFVIYGKKVYAMADGKVLHYENKVPNNWKPDGSDAGMKKQKDELWGSFDYGGSGNHFYIKHGDVVALYAHFQKNSLNKKFLKNGAIIKKGDFLGLAGNSGNSSGPHLHVHIKKYKNDAEPEGGIFRPLLFNTGYVIGTAKYPKPKSNIHWSKLNNQGIPGQLGKACFVSTEHPYCEYPTNWAEVTRHGVSEAHYQDAFDSIVTCGYYPVWVDGYDVNGKTYFNAIFRSAKNVRWVARHNMGGAKYQTEFDKWAGKGYRLININSYLLKGGIRYAAVWKKDASVKWMAYHGRSLSWHENNFQKHWKAGYVPRNVSCINKGGKTYVTALWEKIKTGGFYLRPVMTLQQFKDYFDEYTNKKKFKLVYLDAFNVNGSPRLSGIWHKNAPDYNSWWEKHHLTAAAFQQEFDTMLDKGYQTRCIAGYQHGNGARFEGIWSK